MASSSATTIMASQTHFVSASHRLLHHPIQPKLSLLHFHKPPRSSSLSLLSATKPRSLSISAQTKAAELSETSRTSSSAQDLLRGSTRTITTILGTTLLFLRTFQKFLPKLLHSNSAQLSSSFGSLFFASLKDRPEGFLNTPLTVVAAGLGKWLDIYSGVLMVRVLLSWFPNIPWERQPLCAIRDLCDPYLNLFRNIIPPVFDTLDVSPLLAFAVLGTLGSILHTAMV